MSLPRLIDRLARELSPYFVTPEERELLRKHAADLAKQAREADITVEKPLPDPKPR